MQNVPTPRCRCEAHAVLVGTRNAEWDAKMLCDSCSFSAKWCSYGSLLKRSTSVEAASLGPKSHHRNAFRCRAVECCHGVCPLAPFGCGRKETADGCAMRSINEAATDRARATKEKSSFHTASLEDFTSCTRTGRPFVVIDCITVNRPRGRADHPRRHSHLKG